MSIAAINAVCATFFRYDPPDTGDSPTLAEQKAYARGRLHAIEAVRPGIAAVPFRPVDEVIRTTVRSHFLRAKTIYEQIVALPESTPPGQVLSPLEAAQREVVNTAVGLIKFGATSCIPSSTSPPVASPADAGALVNLAPAAVIKVAEPLLDNKSIIADEHAVWVGVRQDHRVVRIDPAADTVVANVAVGAEILEPLAVVDGRLWVETTNEIVRISEATNRIDWRLPLAGLALPGDDFAVNGDTLWVCARDVVHRVAISSKRRGADIAAGGGCKGGALIATDRDVIVSLSYHGRVRIARFDIASGRLAAAIDLPPQGDWALARAPNGHFFFDSFRISELDIERGRVVRSVARGGSLGDEVALGSGAFWMTRPRERRVVRYDVASGRLDEFVAGAGPIAVAYANGDVWVTNSDDGTVMRFRVDPWPPKR